MGTAITGQNERENVKSQKKKITESFSKNTNMAKKVEREADLIRGDNTKKRLTKTVD